MIGDASDTVEKMQKDLRKTADGVSIYMYQIHGCM